MRRRFCDAMLTVAAAIAVGSFTQVPVSGQAPTAAAKTWTQPRTPWGDPDLQGIWDQATGTPLERPRALAGKAVLTDEEAAAREKGRFTARDASKRAYPSEGWLEGSKNALNRTSLVVDPPDGRIPYSPAGLKRATEKRVQYSGSPASWEDRPIWDRCLTRGVPRIPNNYLSNMHILQNPGSVVIVNEMIHETRIIPLGGLAHVGADIRLWMGDARGHWEGTTLVIETTNFHKDQFDRNFFAIDVQKVVERFRQVDAETLDYEFTIYDPVAYTRPWTANLPLTKNGATDRILEYACHEGNRSLEMALGGARADERAGIKREPTAITEEP